MIRAVPLVAAAAALLLSLPARRQVAGLSMAPGLMPGDRVASGFFPAFDRWRQPRRHERWVFTSPDAEDAVKRVVGLEGESVRFVDGDLELDGRIEPPPPGPFLERATVVSEVAFPPSAAAVEIAADGETFLDDAEFAPRERRLLLPVSDVGACVFARVGARIGAGVESAAVSIVVGDRAVSWRPSGRGVFALVAGRIDRHLVAAAWRFSDGAQGGDWPAVLRAAPERWAVVETMYVSGPPRLVVRIGGEPDHRCGIDRIFLWRDVFHRPAADGRTAWRIGPKEVFLLGDFPSGSIDSRHWGPVERAALRYRVVSRDRGGSRVDAGLGR